MDEPRFIFLCWPDGSWTIALNRDYHDKEIDQLLSQ